MPVAEYFSPEYSSARTLFRRTAQSAGAVLKSYELPGHRGPAGEPLSIDVARVGVAEPDRTLIIISGTHGVEGFCGSGCQVGFFVDQLYRALPATASALLIHALNPFGFAWLRRVNEDGVDLNRNCIDFSSGLPSSAAYEALHDHLVPAEWEGEARREADLALNAYVTQHGLRAFQSAITAGQYSRPTGLFYGGTEPSWSARTLAAILHEHLPRRVRHLAVLDLHTGLGPSAYGEPILTSGGASDPARASSWFGPETKDLSADESVSAQLIGTLAEGVRRARPEVELTFLGLEFGTRPMMKVLTALRADHWMHASTGVARSVRASIQAQMRNAFYCESPDWQVAVYGRAADFIYRACRGLASCKA